MLFPVAGSKLFIADEEVPSHMPPASVPDAAWVEVGEAEAFGVLGGRYELEEAHYMGGDGYMAAKGVHRPETMQVILGLDPADAGQIILRRAYRSREAFPFRLLFADGVTERRWFALVMSVGEVFDAANNVMRLQADLHPVANPHR
ncbi:hypothetical protein [Paracoccus rhizosphaerae]|uniref:Uncharacterized protein n=1 Tax=Paracoccus rhizosphaerae TaxID=1133347 RepID=A0ABV6CFU8_9RHOB|nr:hypothetical protein [Paracoccus rhizosphaerae]